jgi:hypothetical protein
VVGGAAGKRCAISLIRRGFRGCDEGRPELRGTGAETQDGANAGAVRDAAGGELYGYHSTYTMPNDDCLLDIKLVANIGQIFRILFDGGVFSRSTAQRVAILPSRGTRGSVLRGSCWMPLEGIVRLVRLGFSRYSNNNLTSQ